MREMELGSLSVELPDEPAGADAVARPDFGHIDFTGLPNTRDLGGLPAADGRRVRPGLLLRSGNLGFGSEGDLARLRDEYGLKLVVDLRNEVEISEVPDPMDAFPGARYVNACILRSENMGITQEASARVRAAQQRAREANDPVVFMEELYPDMLLEEAGIEGYGTFLHALAACGEGAALWHCYVGRDRCGLASVLLESALGVPRAAIENDYLATNLFAPRELTVDGPASLRSLGAALAAVEREFGSVAGYIRDALGVSDDEVAALRERYLA